MTSDLSLGDLQNKKKYEKFSKKKSFQIEFQFF